MKVLFYSIKGGQGKTTHAVGYAKHTGAKLYTNDHGNNTLEIYSDLLEPGQMTVIHPGESINVKEAKNAVFDFGGWVDDRVLETAQLVDVCVVPICYQSAADLLPGINTITAIAKHTSNIVILINNTDNDFIEDLKAELQKQFPSFPVFVVNKSRYITRLADEGKTVFDLFELGGVHKHTLRTLLPQIKEFYSYLDNR